MVRVRVRVRVGVRVSARVRVSGQWEGFGLGLGPELVEHHRSLAVAKAEEEAADQAVSG